MVMTSSQIAQMNGSFQQQYMQNQSMAGMIQPPGFNFGGYNTGAQNEGLAAGVMNRGAGIGAPVAALGLGMMGLDPLSMGIRGGMAAHGMGLGLGGSMMAGAAVAAPMMAGMAGISYMGGQMMSGAQQSQQFNQSMREGYSFFNPHGQHGRGFSEGGIRQIGGDLRNMAGQGGAGQFGGTMNQFELGPSFAELGRLASSMGRMGMADGVRNAKEFTDKFKEMMKTVKTIAEEMGTSLEEAQKTMAAMKGSGVFRNQAGVTSSIRAASVAGGLATTEVTGMMNVGSQISRMYGGTGRQGAMGGIRSIEQVGMAVQTGALSEEDIYNTTGLTGAEGRRAMAQQNLMQTGSFLKSSKGRWLLASLAGKDGKLDQGSINDFLAGGMGVGDTRGAAHRNLSGVGRANFIRNEGRLRGSVMEEFGGMAPAMAMMGWAQGKGIDINSMGDREMLFMQRQLGLGRDEADSMVKMARALPDMLQHRRAAKQDDMFSREHGLRAQGSGIEGIKRKLDAAKDSVNNEMQKVGQDVLSSMTDAVAEWGNKLAGTYEERAIEGIREAHRVAISGGRAGKAATASLVGGGNFGKLHGAKGGEGFLHEDVGQARYRDKMQGLQFSARMATLSGVDPEVSKLLSGSSSDLLSAYGGGGLAGLAGEDRLAGFKRKFGKDTALGKHFRGLDEKGQAAFLQQAELSIGMEKGLLSETMQIPGLPQLVGGGDDHTNAKANERLGRSMLGLERGGLARAADTMGKIGGGIVGGQVALGMTVGGGLLGAGIGAVPGAMYGAKAAGWISKGMGALGELAGDAIERLTGNAGKAQTAGALMDNAEMRKLSFDMLSGTEGAQDRLNKMRMSIMGAAAERGGMDKLTDSERATLGGLAAVELTAKVNTVINGKGGLSKMTDADWAPLIAARKREVAAAGGDPSRVTKEEILNMAKGVGAGAQRQQSEIMDKLSKQVGRTTRDEMQVLSMGGIASLRSTGKGAGRVESMELTAEAEKSLRASGGEGAVQAAKSAMAAQSLGLRLGQSADPAEQARLYEEYATQKGKTREEFAGLDVKSLRALGSKLAGTDEGDMATSMVMRGQAMAAGKRRKGAFGAVADQLGVHLDKDQLAAMKGKSPEAQAAALARELGVAGDKDFVQGLTEAIGTVGQKGGEIKGADILARARTGASAETQKKLTEHDKSQQGPQEKILDALKQSNDYLKIMADGVKPTQHALANLGAEFKLFSQDGEK